MGGSHASDFEKHSMSVDLVATDISRLCNDFDIRIVILFREPIKRLFSHCVHLYRSGWFRVKGGWDNKIKPPRELFLDILNLSQFQNLYPDVKNRFEKVFSNIIFLSTENFFTNQSEHDKLSNFLGVSKITMSDLYENKTDYEYHITAEDIELARAKLLPSIEIHKQL